MKLKFNPKIRHVQRYTEHQSAAVLSSDSGRSRSVRLMTTLQRMLAIPVFFLAQDGAVAC